MDESLAMAIKLSKEQGEIDKMKHMSDTDGFKMAMEMSQKEGKTTKG